MVALAKFYSFLVQIRDKEHEVCNCTYLNSFTFILVVDSERLMS